MKTTRKYLVINYNRKKKEQITVIQYVVRQNTFGHAYVANKIVYHYNNIFHYLKNYGQQTINKEIEEGFEIIENKTEKEIINIYKNMQY